MKVGTKSLLIKCTPIFMASLYRNTRMARSLSLVAFVERIYLYFYSRLGILGLPKYGWGGGRSLTGMGCRDLLRRYSESEEYGDEVLTKVSCKRRMGAILFISLKTLLR